MLEAGDPSSFSPHLYSSAARSLSSRSCASNLVLPDKLVKLSASPVRTSLGARALAKALRLAAPLKGAMAQSTPYGYDTATTPRTSCLSSAAALATTEPYE
eukprot:scaffold977_cov253-Pinguiococcus_pyrenoidosus.AAC.5